MINKPQINFFQAIIDAYRDTFNKAYDTVMNEDVSRYPILVFTSSEIELGLDISQDHDGLWNIRISTLEEFAAKKLIDAAKVDDFISLYNDSRDKFCIFYIHEDHASFLFHPRYEHGEQVSDEN